MFKITLGALLASFIGVFLTTRRQRWILFGSIFLIFTAIEIIFIASGGD